MDIQNLQYTVPSDFDLGDWLSRPLGVWRSGSEDLQTTRIHFSRSTAKYIQESTWHESQPLFPQPDGTVIAEFELPDNEEILNWFLSFGSNATVLKPTALVERISEKVQRMLQT